MGSFRRVNNSAFTPSSWWCRSHTNIPLRTQDKCGNLTIALYTAWLLMGLPKLDTDLLTATGGFYIWRGVLTLSDLSSSIWRWLLASWSNLNIWSLICVWVRFVWKQTFIVYITCHLRTLWYLLSATIFGVLISGLEQCVTVISLMRCMLSYKD